MPAGAVAARGSEIAADGHPDPRSAHPRSPVNFTAAKLRRQGSAPLPRCGAAPPGMRKPKQRSYRADFGTAPARARIVGGVMIPRVKSTLRVMRKARLEEAT